MIASKLDDDEGTVGGGADVDRSGSNKKLSKSRKSTIPGNSAVIEELKFLIFDAKEVFNLLWQAFTKVPIFQYFDLECYIWIKTNASGYVIGVVLSQLTFDQLILKIDQTLIKSDFG